MTGLHYTVISPVWDGIGGWNSTVTIVLPDVGHSTATFPRWASIKRVALDVLVHRLLLALIYAVSPRVT